MANPGREAGVNILMESERAVILDYGGVICFHPSESQIAEAAAACGLTVPDFLEAFWKHRIAYDAGQDAYEYWRTVAATAGRHFDAALIAQMIEREIDFWLHWDQRVLAWTRELRASGVRIGILSNLPRPLGTRLRADREFMSYFDHATLSFELGVVKPQREIYDDAVRGLNVSAGDALFLDDRPENVAGARSAGLQAEVYTSWEDYEARRQ
jgi:putative hydrolase of the HAD superfamily